MATNTCGHVDSTGTPDCDEPRWTKGATYCQGHRGSGSRITGARVTRKPASGFGPIAPPAGGDLISDEEMVNSHEYIPMRDLVDLFRAKVAATKRGKLAANFLFVGPPGSGKTDGAKYLAALVQLPFLKVDSSSMTDPEAWFGTREIVVENGVAVTRYVPSALVEAIQKPGFTLIDEINRVTDSGRQVLLPWLDATRTVMNPLTGQPVTRHPQHFIAMAGNVGLQYTGTSAMDPAFLTRALTVEFDYAEQAAEQKIVEQASGCSADDAYVFVRFAAETRAKAASDPEFQPISTRELIEMGEMARDGLSRDLAVKFGVLNSTSSEGGSASVRQELKNIWNGVRVARPERGSSGPAVSWTCSVHPTVAVKTVPAGVSSKTGKAYSTFQACGSFGCPNTSDRTPAGSAPGTQGATISCAECGATQPVGRSTLCGSCGATL